MSSNSPLFQSAFARLIESFAPHFHKFLYEFEDKMEICSGIAVEKIIHDIFTKFPRCLPQYKNLIKTLTKLSSFDPKSNIEELAYTFKKLLSQSKNTPFQMLQNLSLIFKQDNRYHQELIIRFGIYLTTDLICQICREYGYNDSCQELIKCGIEICLKNEIKFMIDVTILKQWAVIFSIISETDYQLIYNMFQSIISLEEYETAFFFIEYMRLDCISNEEFNNKFLLDIFNLLTKLKTEQKITINILKSTSRLLQSQKKYIEPLDSIFDLAWNLRNDRDFTEGAIDIICVLFPLFSSKKSQCEQFYYDFVYVNIENKTYVAKCLYLFQILIYGIQFDPRWLYWEWGLNPRLHQFSYLRWNSQPEKHFSDPTSFLSIFMNTFFLKADFSVCIHQFSNILLHFAALDFQYFMNNVMDSFLNVPINDPRFVSFLMIIPQVNTPDFIDYASKPVTFSDMGTFNEKIKNKVIEALSVFTFEFLSEHGVRGDQISSLETMICTCDLKVEKRLDEWKMNNQQKTDSDHGVSVLSTDIFTLPIQLAKCLPYIIPIEDYNTPEMMRIILQLSFNASLSISSAAYPICENIITDENMRPQFINIILDYIKGPTSCESLFTCISLLNDMLKSNPRTLQIDILHDIEFAGIRGAVSVHPTCRLISVKLLKMANIILRNQGCYRFIEVNIDKIQQVANKNLIHSFVSHSQNKITTRPNKLIKFNQAACSHYYDIWLFFVSEIANIIVAVNYTPLLYRLVTNLDSYINALFSINSCCCNNATQTSNCKISPSQSSSTTLNSIVKPNSIPTYNSQTKSNYNIYASSSSNVLPNIQNIVLKLPDSPIDLSLSSGDITNLFNASSTDSQMNVGLLIFYIAAHFDIASLIKTPSFYNCILYAQFENHDSSLGQKAVSTIKHLLKHSGLDKLAFSVLEHSHFSLFPSMITMLSSVKTDQLENTATTIRIMLKSPYIISIFARDLLKPVFSFIFVIQNYANSEKINSSRIIHWTEETEKNVIKHKKLACDFCAIIAQYLKKLNGHASNDEWPIASRETIFRFMMNWITTTSLELETLRSNASKAIVRMIRIGPIFQDSKFFNLSSLQVLSTIKVKGLSILSFVLYFHVELLLEQFIDACYKEVLSSANLYFTSIFMAFDAEHSSFLYNHSASLLMLGFVAHAREHSRSIEFLAALIDIITQGKASLNYESTNILSEIAKQLSYLTEAIFEQGFRILKMPFLRISRKDIIDILIIWSNNIRLLPNQPSCIFDIPPEFHKYTPYGFLEQLMKTTEEVLLNYSSCSNIVPLWATLSKMPDHNELIPLFLFDWPNSKSKQMILSQLILTNAENIVKQIAQRCSFAYFYHVVVGLNQDFENEFWIIPLLTKVFQMKNEKVISLIPYVLHFAFLFVKRGTCGLLRVLCHSMGIVIPDTLSQAIIVSAVQQFIEKFKKVENGKEYIETWGREALKWLLGSPKLEHATISLIIFNQILTPIEPLVISGVCKAVKYHIDHTFHLNSANHTHKTRFSLRIDSIDDNSQINSENIDSYLEKRENRLENSNTALGDSIDVSALLKILIQESFSFYCSIFEGNEIFAFSYISSFIDCRVFVESCLEKASDLFTKCLISSKTSSKVWECVIGIIRPLLPKLEVDEHIQKMFELLLQSKANEELLMIVAPIHHCHKSLFNNTKPLNSLLETVSESILCNTLLHYASMINTASLDLLNSIYLISSQIIAKINDKNINQEMNYNNEKNALMDNNLNSLTTIYKSALRNLTVCPKAVDFICSIAKFHPETASLASSKNHHDLYDWERSLESVCCSLNELIVADSNKVISLTDCSTIQSVYNLLNQPQTFLRNSIPRILPFTAQRKMINGMKTVDIESRIVLSQNTKNKSAPLFTNGIHGVNHLSYTPPQKKLAPITKPNKIMQNSSLFQPDWQSELQFTSSDFL
ncbi:hypothetical protein TRFO_34285 [Tritrichomonas foetus]|uniref:Uncharacterized protein n=1 Tax=Tritrichomonas foetus TaxID=1144522 RepID=A0A1J4JLN1_9EUKA|nr:hypothetical protein TRFO_34285 [Tritrichomonas foetus]|eukprot:OHS99311.1 hypothetical protein TRFO_34285 [Tritrichomonas foetus]